MTVKAAAKATKFTKRQNALNMRRKNKLIIDEVKKLADEAGKMTEQR